MSEIPSVHAGGITGADLGDDPIERFRTWLEEAREAGVLFPEAAALATADARGRPAVRHVLVKGADERGGFLHKPREPQGTAPRREPERGARVPVARARPPSLRRRDGRAHHAGGIGGLLPHAASRGAGRGVGLDAESRRFLARGARGRLSRDRGALSGDVPLPAHWGGLRLEPVEVEFWKGREHRLHDRFRFTRDAGEWRPERLWAKRAGFLAAISCLLSRMRSRVDVRVVSGMEKGNLAVVREYPSSRGVDPIPT